MCKQMGYTHPWPETWKESHCNSIYLSCPVLDTLRSLSYLSTKYSRIARVSLNSDQRSIGGDDHSKDLPNNEVVVMVVDDGGDAAIGVNLQEVWGLVLSLAEIEVDVLVRQPKLFENDGNFPKN